MGSPEHHLAALKVMSPYLYGLIGAFAFAIAYGMHFTVAPLPGAHAHIATLVETPGPPPLDLAAWTWDGHKLADSRF